MRFLGLFPPCLLAYLAVAAMADEQASAPRRQMIASAAEAGGRHAPLIEADRAIARAYLARGRLYLERGQLDMAIADFNSAVKLRPRDTSAYLERSGAYVRKGDLSSGLADFQKCMQLITQQQDALAQELRCIKQSLRSLHEQPISVRRLQIPEALERGSQLDVVPKYWRRTTGDHLMFEHSFHPLGPLPGQEPQCPQVPESIDRGMIFDALEHDRPGDQR